MERDISWSEKMALEKMALERIWKEHKEILEDPPSHVSHPLNICISKIFLVLGWAR